MYRQESKEKSCLVSGPCTSWLAHCIAIYIFRCPLVQYFIQTPCTIGLTWLYLALQTRHAAHAVEAGVCTARSTLRLLVVSNILCSIP